MFVLYVFGLIKDRYGIGSGSELFLKNVREHFVITLEYHQIVVRYDNVSGFRISVVDSEETV